MALHLQLCDGLLWSRRRQFFGKVGRAEAGVVQPLPEFGRDGALYLHQLLCRRGHLPPVHHRGDRTAFAGLLAQELDGLLDQGRNNLLISLESLHFQVKASRVIQGNIGFGNDRIRKGEQAEQCRRAQCVPSALCQPDEGMRLDRGPSGTQRFGLRRGVGLRKILGEGLNVVPRRTHRASLTVTLILAERFKADVVRLAVFILEEESHHHG